MITKLTVFKEVHNSWDANERRKAGEAWDLLCLDVSEPAEHRMEEMLYYRLKPEERLAFGVGIALAPDGYLKVFPAAKVPRDFLAAVRERKGELRACLEARAPWLHVAKQILLGEFDGCDGSTCRKLADGR